MPERYICCGTPPKPFCPVCNPSLAREGRRLDSPFRSPLREYLVDQLVIAATWLTESHIYRKDPNSPSASSAYLTGTNSAAPSRIFRRVL